MDGAWVTILGRLFHIFADLIEKTFFQIFFLQLGFLIFSLLPLFDFGWKTSQRVEEFHDHIFHVSFCTFPPYHIGFFYVVNMEDQGIWVYQCTPYPCSSVVVWWLFSEHSQSICVVSLKKGAKLYEHIQGVGGLKIYECDLIQVGKTSSYKAHYTIGFLNFWRDVAMKR